MQFATRGDRQSPAILFFHAMGVTGASSEPVARYLQQNYYCILPTSSVYCAGRNTAARPMNCARSRIFCTGSALTAWRWSWRRPSGQTWRRHFWRRPGCRWCGAKNRKICKRLLHFAAQRGTMAAGE